MCSTNHLSRREFLAGTGALLLGNAIGGQAETSVQEPIIDIHQHVHYAARPDDVLLIHQRAMGISHTILLPAGTPAFGTSTHQGKTNGLQAQCAGNEACYGIAQKYPGEFVFGANEVPDLPDAIQEIEKYLKERSQLRYC